MIQFSTKVGWRFSEGCPDPAGEIIPGFIVAVGLRLYSAVTPAASLAG
jgi:hypothetical protein